MASELWKRILILFGKHKKMREPTEEEKFAKYVADTRHRIQVLRSQADVAWGRGHKEESSRLHDEARELTKTLLDVVKEHQRPLT